MRAAEDHPKPFVEILANGDMLFSGKLISAHEFAASAALASLKVPDSKVVSPGGPEKPEVNTVISELSDESKESVENVTISAPKRRKNKVTKPIDLPPDDVRLSYAQKYFDGVNAVDAAVMKQNLSEMCIPKVVLMGKVASGSPNAAMFHFPTHFEVVGLDAIATFNEETTKAVPDFEVSVLHEQIMCYVNGESSIELTIHAKGTMVFEIDGFAEGDEKVVLSSGAADEGLASVLSGLSVNTNVVSNVESSRCGGGVSTSGKEVRFGVGELRKVRKPFTLNYRITFHLNAAKKIFLIVNSV